MATLSSAWFIKAFAHVRLRLLYGQWNTKPHVIGRILEDSPLDSLLFQLSLDKNKYAMLTIKDRKVYVGKIIGLGEPSETYGMDQDILIIPLMSGYRDKDDLRVHFTTNYEDVGVDIFLSLRQEAILSATEFSFAAYKRLHSVKWPIADEGVPHPTWYEKTFSGLHHS